MSLRSRSSAAALLALATLLTAAQAASPPPEAAATTAPRAGMRAPATAPYATQLPAGRFGKVTVYIPEGQPASVALFLSGDGGWELGVVNMAHALAALGAVVIGVDIRQYFASLHRAAQRPGAPCQMIAADFEALSHQVQKEIGMSDYHVPVLVGYSSGATVAYATLVQSPPGTFAGALSLGFCADQDFAGAALCPGAGLHYSENPQHELVLEPAHSLRQPWIAFQGQKDQVCNPHAADEFAAAVAGGAIVRLPLVGHGFGVERNWMPQFRDAYRRLTAHLEAAPERPADISDLPVQEVHAGGNGKDFALLLTGDGGWAGLDQELAARLAAQGVPTVGLNSLKYFWTERTADQTARDVARVLHHYLSAWNKQRVLLIGYSFGADVLPFVVNRLPPELRARIASVSLLGIDAHASFEVRISDWVGNDEGGPPTRPELDMIGHVPVLCLYGEGEADSICPGLSEPGIAREQVGKGHHFSGEYDRLADRILAFARTGRPVT
ncbi:MAG TPA: AcvB/VirJ family lysyl-phosphatidylglycerol hydrolase [Candidatus Dormibacteraeota bacterium]|nr:AcvB/VirJ family lysyl-phosphatidylglycerol hydrolase [Candidatus Dormibacteraeota bacterium]